MAASTLIDALRQEEIDSVQSEVGHGRRAHILKTLDERGRAQELVRQQYTGRYPFELLQNANDAAGDKGASGGVVRFLLTEHALLVADQGSGFGPDQIRAICGLGRSSKDPRKSIGYKGLGFKSVGEISDLPQVISSGARFTFDEARVRKQIEDLAGELPAGQRVPFYAFPFQLTDEDLGNDLGAVERLLETGFQTVLRLPLRVGVKTETVRTHLWNTITPRLLLFLDAVDQLELSGTGDHDFKALVIRQPSNDYTETLLEARDVTEHWLVYERPVSLPRADLVTSLGDAWKTVEQVRVAAAVQLDSDGRPSNGGGMPLHVYFPTEEQIGVPIILQADFALDLDRRHVARSPEAEPYNRWLSCELARLLGERVAPSLARHFPEDAAVVGALALHADPTDFGKIVRDDCLDALRTSAFVPCIDGSLRCPGDVALLPSTVPSSMEAHLALDLTDLGHLTLPEVGDDVPSRQLLVDHLDAVELDFEVALGRFKPPPPEYEHRVYEFLVGWSEEVGMRGFSRALAEVPCVRTLGGHWKAPGAGVFFPRQRGEVDLPEDIEVPIAKIPETDGLRALLESAGVRPFEWRSLLPDFVLPLLVDEAKSKDVRAAALRAVRAYFETERTGDPRLRAQLARILLPAKTALEEEDGLRSAEDLYFSKEWLKSDRLERIYGPFGAPEFLAIAPPENDDQRRNDEDFYSWLGVARYPRCDERRTDQRDTFMVTSLYRHPHRVNGEMWESWITSQAFLHASQCDQGHTASQQLRASYALDRFPELVATCDADRLALLWIELVSHWGSVYEEAMHAEFYCQNTSHVGDRMRTGPSLLHHMLTQLPWVPSLLNREACLVQPGKAWRVTAETPRRIAERVPVLDRGLDTPAAWAFATAVGVVDGARPDAGDLIDLLTQLAEEHEKAQSTDEDRSSLYSAARWAMRTLSGVVEDGKEVRAGAVPLLARVAGRHVFVVGPFVAEDPLLAETWESTHAILDADRDLRPLHRALDLRSLDAEVQVRPVPERPRPDRRDAVEAWIVRAKPYLAAVASEAVPSRRDDVFRGLARLEVVVCDDLVLEYELDGEVRRRPEAVSYISERIEQEGSARRRIGTAHLELSEQTRQPHWYAFGPQLAQFLGVPTQGDAFALLLGAEKEDRNHYLTARRISPDLVDEARVRLDQPPDDEVLDDLLQGVVTTEDADQAIDAGALAERGRGASNGGTHPPDTTFGPTSSSGSLELPDLDLARLVVLDALEEAEVPERPESTGRGSAGWGPSGPVDLESQDRVRRVIGRRGEEVVYHAERVRLKSLGLDPDCVVWRSRDRPFAAYDIESLDKDGQRIYIEVKSSASDDPTDPFEISEAELLFALQKRSSYYVYRVTSAHASVPSILRYQDPVARIQSGRAHLRLSGARMSFADGPASSPTD